MSFDREPIEAELALDRIPSNEMPKLAWDALEAGFDGPAIRRLAAFNSPTHFEVRDVLPKAMTEMGMSQLPPLQAGIRLAQRWADELLRLDAVDLLARARLFEQLYIYLDYPPELQGVGTLDDEIYVARTMGSNEPEIVKMVRNQLNLFLESVAKQRRDPAIG